MNELQLRAMAYAVYQYEDKVYKMKQAFLRSCGWHLEDVIYGLWLKGHENALHDVDEAFQRELVERGWGEGYGL